jgi:transketolase
MFAAHNKVDNFIVTVDYNGRQIDGDTKDVLSLGNLHDKFNAFGWHVISLENGNDMEQVVQVLREAKNQSSKGKPIVIIMTTEMGYPIDFMVGSHKWHGVAPNDAQLESALAQLPITLGDY